MQSLLSVTVQEAKDYFATPRPPESAASWSPPSSSTFKIIVDASFTAASHMVGFGIVAKNHELKELFSIGVDTNSSISVVQKLLKPLLLPMVFGFGAYYTVK